MNSSLLQILVLAGIAIFLVIKLRSVLGSREGFEKPPLSADDLRPARRNFEVIEGGPDRDITDQVAEDSSSAKALSAMKAVEPSFSVAEFLKGARSAYEMILMAFEKGELDRIRPFLSDEVEHTFGAALEARAQQGLTITSTFLGIRDLALAEATFDPASKTAEISVRFTGELQRAVKDKTGALVEGSGSEVKRQRDTWTFARRMGEKDPNWQLVATGD